jgi:hypothetical protein
LHRLNNVSVVYLVQVSVLPIGQQGFGTFLQVSALVSNWLEDCAKFMPTPEGTTNTAPTTLSTIQAASQSTFINAQL